MGRSRSKKILARAPNSQMQLRDLPGQCLTTSKPSPGDRCSLGTGCHEILDHAVGAVNGVSPFIKKTYGDTWAFAAGLRDSLGSASSDNYNLSANSPTD